MKRWFSTTLPCRPHAHYMVPAMERLPGVRERVAQGGLFAVHGPRGIGKTTALMGAAVQLTEEGRFAALHVSCGDARGRRGEPGPSHRAVIAAIEHIAQVRLPAALRPPRRAIDGDHRLILRHLSAWTVACPRPLVVFFDDVDALEGEALESFLAQVRAGQPHRPSGFPWCVALCGRRDVLAGQHGPEGALHVGEHGPEGALHVGEHGPEGALHVGELTLEQVRDLYGQHTRDTGQLFTPEAVSTAFQITAGRPAVVNALARDIVERMRVPVSEAVTERHVLLAKYHHLQAIGEIDALDPAWAPESMSPIEIERIARSPSLSTARLMRGRPERFLLPDGRLAVRRIWRALAVFWRRHAGALVRAAIRPTEAPLRIFFKFVYEILVACGDGVLVQQRRYGPTGFLLVFHHELPDGTPAAQRRILDVRVWREGQSDPRRLALRRLDRNLRRVSLSRGTLLIFDTRGEIGARRARFEEVTTPQENRVLVVHV